MRPRTRLAHLEEALAACVEYDRWAREVQRLTGEISLTTCPEWRPETPESCFERASVLKVARNSNNPDDDPPRRLWLAEVAKEVADCPECSRLCVLIAERREARKRWGIAKRAVRVAGRRKVP